MGRKSDESSTSSPSLVLLASYMAIVSGFCYCTIVVESLSGDLCTLRVCGLIWLI